MADKATYCAALQAAIDAASDEDREQLQAMYDNSCGDPQNSGVHGPPPPPPTHD